jgi:diguanylate cyclase (GGDEF)-like protein
MQTESAPTLPDPRDLPLIERALAGSRWFPRMAPSLLRQFNAAGEASRHANNRGVIVVLTLLFDLFWLPQRHTAPDIVLASGVLRFAVFTPGALLFMALDQRGRLGRFYDGVLLLLALAPCLITARLCLTTHEMLAQPEIYGTPLILLFTGVLLRMRLPMVVANAAVCTAVYVVSIVVCPMLPHDQLATAIFIQLVVGVAVVMFNLQLEARDRRVFLLTLNERIRRALVAEQNTGLLRDAQTDTLTGIANRRCFDETLSFIWMEALRSGASIGLVMIDIDRFKAFNDHYGHVMGDDCLGRVAATLATIVRRSDVVARYGGEEFAAILASDSLEDARATAERLRRAVEDMRLPHEGLGGGAIVTVSLGVAYVRPSDPHGARKLIELADSSLYAAKRAGRNRVVCASPPGPAEQAAAATARQTA